MTVNSGDRLKRHKKISIISKELVRWGKEHLYIDRKNNLYFRQKGDAVVKQKRRKISSGPGLSSNEAIGDKKFDKTTGKVFSSMAESYADGIYRLLVEQGNGRRESYVIGIEGKWGTGKTSFINILMNNLALKLNKPVKSIAFKFTPWWFEGQPNINAKFFNNLSKFLTNKNNQPLIKAMKKIGQMLAEIPQEEIKISGKILEKISDYFTSEKKDIESLREKISGILRKRSNPLFIIIDDLDRLTDSEIANVFALVKSIGKFPNIHYILAYDQKRVAQAIAKHNFGVSTDAEPKCGYDFLEKIVQLQITPPRISEEDIKDKFTGRIKNIVQYYSKGEINLDQEKIVDYILPFIETARNSRMVCNEMLLLYPSVEDRVNPFDFLAITTLRILRPKLYHKLEKEYRNHFLNHSIEEWHPESQKSHEKEIKQLRKFIEEKSNENNLLVELFPRFARLINQSNKEQKSPFRIANPKNEDTYFYNAQSSLPYGRKDLDFFLSPCSAEEKDKKLKRVQDNIEMFKEDCHLRIKERGGKIDQPEELLKYMLMDLEEPVYVKKPTTSTYDLVKEILLSTGSDEKSIQIIYTTVKGWLENKEIPDQSMYIIKMLIESISEPEIWNIGYKKNSQRYVYYTSGKKIRFPLRLIQNFIEKDGMDFVDLILRIQKKIPLYPNYGFIVFHYIAKKTAIYHL